MEVLASFPGSCTSAEPGNESMEVLASFPGSCTWAEPGNESMEVKTAACPYKPRCDQLCGVLMSLKLLESYWLVFYTQVKSDI